jgi:hypothetical protein
VVLAAVYLLVVSLFIKMPQVLLAQDLVAVYQYLLLGLTLLALAVAQEALHPVQVQHMLGGLPIKAVLVVVLALHGIA